MKSLFQTKLPRAPRWLTAGLVLLFVLNDFIFARAETYIAFLAVDYVFRCVVIGAVLYIVRRHPALSFTAVLVTRGSDDGNRIVLWTVVTVLVGLLVDHAIGPWLYYRLPYLSYYTLPQPDDVFTRWFDAFVGSGLTALSEEMVFRFLLPIVLLSLGVARVWTFTFVVVAFGVAHWGLGPEAILSSALWGIVPLVSVERTNALAPAVIAHFLTNAVAFAGLLPAEYYLLFQPS